MIRIQGLRKDFVTGGQVVTALNDVTLHVPPASIFGVVGLSGAGKSTLVRCLAALESPTRGRIWLDGEELTQRSAAELRRLRQRIGMVFQHFHLLLSRTAAENIALPLELRRWPSHRIRQRVVELLQLVGLSDKADAYPAALSGGQRQRVGIARAIAANPSVLLCDEATSALDPETTQTITQLLQSIQRQTQITIVMVTHELGVVQDVCSHVAVMESGMVAEVGRVEQVLLAPKSVAAKRLISSIWPLDPPAHLLSHLSGGPQGVSSLLRLTFSGQVAMEPVISRLVRMHDLSVNILHGGIGQVGSKPFGQLLVQLECSPAMRRQAIAYLVSQQVGVEEVHADGGH
ncbi:MAG: methionine ABC transporter ATP-binding protein [Bacillota bacterium]